MPFVKWRVVPDGTARQIRMQYLFIFRSGHHEVLILWNDKKIHIIIQNMLLFYILCHNNNVIELSFRN